MVIEKHLVAAHFVTVVCVCVFMCHIVYILKQNRFLHYNVVLRVSCGGRCS